MDNDEIVSNGRLLLLIVATNNTGKNGQNTPLKIAENDFSLSSKRAIFVLMMC